MVEAVFVGLVVGNDALLGRACAPWGTRERVRAVFYTGTTIISYNLRYIVRTLKGKYNKLTYTYINSKQIEILVDVIYRDE